MTSYFVTVNSPSGDTLYSEPCEARDVPGLIAALMSDSMGENCLAENGTYSPLNTIHVTVDAKRTLGLGALDAAGEALVAELVAPADGGEAAILRDYADLGVSTGYIGNLEPWGDDRSFRVFTRALPAKGGPRYDHDVTAMVTVARDASGHVVRGTPVVWDTPAVRRQLDRIRMRVAAGELFVREGK